MFGLTDEQEQLRKEVRAFAEREVAPFVSEWDEKSEFPHKVVKKLGEMGLMGVIFPEELGGAGSGQDRAGRNPVVLRRLGGCGELVQPRCAATLEDRAAGAV